MTLILRMIIIAKIFVMRPISYPSSINRAKELFQQILSSFHFSNDLQEMRNIAYLLLEHVPGISLVDIVANKKISLKESDVEFLNQAIQRLNNHEPIQYILGHAVFLDRRFIVNKEVLIPRPETEELVNWANEFNLNEFKILDIGTGSGCIAISLALYNMHAEVTGLDVSNGALELAKQNAINLGASVSFINMDVIKGDPEKYLGNQKFDLIISNPPYVTESEKHLMQLNVLDFEPALALFVPDHDPLKFYNLIVEKFKQFLNPKGRMLFEINEHFANEVCELLTSYGFSSTDTRQDIHQKDRMVVGML